MKLFIFILSIVLFSSCAVPQLNEVKDGTQKIEVENTDLVEKDISEPELIFTVNGYASIQNEPIPFCEADCETVDIVYLNVLGELSEDGKEFQRLHGEKIRLGCLSDGQIFYRNDSAFYNFGEFTMSLELSQNIFNASVQNPISLQFEVLSNPGGRSEPPCYVNFTHVSPG